MAQWLASVSRSIVKGTPYPITFRLRKEKEDMTISKELLDILACPKCKGDIYLTEAGDGLICDHCKLLYEIKDDIPIMLIDEAKPISLTEG